VGAGNGRDKGAFPYIKGVIRRCFPSRWWKELTSRWNPEHEMLEKVALMALCPIMNFACRFPRLGQRAFTSKPSKPFAIAAALLIVIVLASTATHSQDKSAAGVAGNDSYAQNSITEIPPATHSSGLSARTGAANSSDANGEDDADGNSYDEPAPPMGENGDGEPPAAGQGVQDNEEGGPPKLANLDEFVSNDDTYESPIGALLQHNCTDLTDRQIVCGLAVLEVRPGSAAAAAGIRPYSGLGHTLLGAAVISAAMVFPPAIAGLGFVEETHIGESFDLIIGVDGHRIRNLPDFQAAISNIRIDDVLYLTVVRSGKRLQIPAKITRQTARG
jgi:PDZ domain